MRFIDLFAGLGGFHLALKELGHKCVFASELNPTLQELYKKNFGITPKGDIRKVPVTTIPKHDILCAGFPCQPFSKAGEQQGRDCPRWGDLFDEVLRVVKHHKPRFLILENVPNLAFHEEGATWARMKKQLEHIGYTVAHKRLSPHHFGIPQIRERIFIIGSLTKLDNFNWPNKVSSPKLSLVEILDPNPIAARKLPEQYIKCIQIWQEFLNLFPENEPLPAPLWSMEFGATYPYKERTPFDTRMRNMGRYRGSHGIRLANIGINSCNKALPSYARSKRKKFPRWKIQFIKNNRTFYKKHKHAIDKWMPKILQFPSSLQKLEWNCKGEERNIWKYVLQIRASGVRVKRRTTAPTLVAMTTTQVPIIAWEKRFMTTRECAKVQSMGNLEYLPESQTAAFEALGNSVNVTLVRLIAQSLLSLALNERHSTKPPSNVSLSTSQKCA